MHPGASIGQVYLCCLPVDFRKQIDGLAALVESELELCLWQKRLEKARFAWPAPGSGPTVTLTPKELEWLLEGFDLWANYPHKTLKYQSVM